MPLLARIYRINTRVATVKEVAGLKMNRQTRHLDTEEHQETRELVKSAFS
jgi:hypothetical protein